jgi:hypothetical protein
VSTEGDDFAVVDIERMVAVIATVTAAKIAATLLKYCCAALRDPYDRTGGEEPALRLLATGRSCAGPG